MRCYDYLACVWHIGCSGYIPTIIITLVSVKSASGHHSFRGDRRAEPRVTYVPVAGSVVLFTLVTYVYYLLRHS